MKQLFVIIAILLSVGSFAQVDCSKLKNGNFKSSEAGRGDLLISRKGKVQTEEHVATGVKLSMDIIWTSDCSYDLKNIKVLKGEFVNPFPSDAVVHNEIIEVNNKSYRVRCWVSVAPDQKFEFTIQII